MLGLSGSLWKNAGLAKLAKKNNWFNVHLPWAPPRIHAPPLQSFAALRKTHKYIGPRKLVAQQQTWAGRLAWLGHLLDVQKVAGPNPVRPILPLILL